MNCVDRTQGLTDWSDKVMRVKCVLCDKIDKIDDQLPLAKRLRNRPIHTYMCNECDERIRERTLERQASGNFTLTYKTEKESEWL